MKRERKHEPYLKLKAFLVESSIPQSEVAGLLGKSISAFNQKLNGTGGDFSIKEARKICDHYNLSMDEFFFRPFVPFEELKIS